MTARRIELAPGDDSFADHVGATVKQITYVDADGAATDDPSEAVAWVADYLDADGEHVGAVHGGGGAAE